MSFGRIPLFAGKIRAPTTSRLTDLSARISCAATVATAAFASVSVTPSLSRPIAVSHHEPREVRSRARSPGFAPIIDTGTHTSTRSECAGPLNAAGTTPITAYALPLIDIERPTMSCRPPNRSCHSFSPITTTVFAPGERSSSGANPRPRIIRTCRTRKKFELTYAPSTRTGSPSEEIANAPVPIAARSANADVVRSR